MATRPYTALLWTNTELMRLKLPFTAVERQELIFLSLSLCLSLMWFIGMLLDGGVAQAVNDIMNNGCHSSIKHLAWFSPDAVLVHSGLIQRYVVPDLKTSGTGDTSHSPVLLRQNLRGFCAYINAVEGDEIDRISQRMTLSVGNDTPICSHLNLKVIPLLMVSLIKDYCSLFRQLKWDLYGVHSVKASKNESTTTVFNAFTMVVSLIRCESLSWGHFVSNCFN